MNKVLMYKKILFGTAATVTSYYLQLAPHTILLDNYKSFVARYANSSNKEVPLQETICKRIQAVMDEMKLEPDVRDLIKPFSVFGFDMFHIGTSMKPFGGYIGIPANFDYFNINYVDKEKILINGEPVDWNEENAMLFLDSLILSEDAQKYAIAREILHLQQNKPIVDASVASGLIMVFYVVYTIAYYELKLFEARPLYRRMIILLCCVFGIGCWITFKDRHHYNSDAAIDKSLCELGLKYIIGGQEFYEKMMQRNIALRNLIGIPAEKHYAVNGNEISWLRQKTMSLSHKKSFFDSKLKDVQQLV